jgi:hypothetical protein
MFAKPEFDYEFIEWLALRTVMIEGYDLHEGIGHNVLFHGLTDEEALKLSPDIDTKSLPHSKDGAIEFPVDTIDFGNLNGAHPWAVTKSMLNYGISERKITECLSYLSSEGYIRRDHKSKRIFITRGGVEHFMLFNSSHATEDESQFLGELNVSH